MTIGALKQLGQALSGTSGAPVTIYTVPSLVGTIARITSIWICNLDSVVRTFTLRVGIGTLTNANSLIEAAPIQASTTYIIDDDEGIKVLTAGMKIQIFDAVGSKFNVTIDGLEVLP